MSGPQSKSWAHRALLLMDEVDALIRFGSANAPADKYEGAAKAFWEVSHMLAAERARLEQVPADEMQPVAFREVAADGTPITDWIDGSLPPSTPPLHPGATIQFAYGAPVTTAFPDALTPDLSYVLGMPNLRCAPYAEVFREAGHDIPCKAEAEQAFVIHRMVRAVLQHGAGWDAAFAAELRAAADRAKTTLPPKVKL